MHAAIGCLRVSIREQGRIGLGLAAQRHETGAFGSRAGFTRNSDSMAAFRQVGTSFRCPLLGRKAPSTARAKASEGC